MEAQWIKLGLVVLQSIFLLFAITYSAVMVRGIGQYIAMIITDRNTSMNTSLILVPSILWAIFFLLVKSDYIIKMMIAIQILK